MAGKARGPEGSGSEPIHDFIVVSDPASAGISNQYDAVIKSFVDSIPQTTQVINFVRHGEGPFPTADVKPDHHSTALSRARDRWAVATQCGPVAIAKLRKPETDSSAPMREALLKSSDFKVHYYGVNAMSEWLAGKPDISETADYIAGFQFSPQTREQYLDAARAELAHILDEMQPPQTSAETPHSDEA